MSQDKPDATPAVRQSNQSFFFQSDIFSTGRQLPRRPRPGGVVHEAARATPVFRDCDVLVVGGGPSGTAAAVAAARTGADVVLLERYNHLGGLSTGGLVIWIDRMTDWTGAQVIRGIATDLLDRLPKDAHRRPAAWPVGQRRCRHRRVLEGAHRRLSWHRHLVSDDRPRAPEARQPGTGAGEQSAASVARPGRRA